MQLGGEAELILKHSIKPIDDQNDSRKSKMDEIYEYLKNNSSINECVNFYWTNNEILKTYPFLSKLAQIVISCPANQSLTEVSFSKFKIRSSGLRTQISAIKLNSPLL